MITGPEMPKQFITLEEHELAKSVLIAYAAYEETGGGLTSKPATRALHKIYNNTCLK